MPKSSGRSPRTTALWSPGRPSEATRSLRFKFPSTHEPLSPVGQPYHREGSVPSASRRAGRTSKSETCGASQHVPSSWPRSSPASRARASVALSPSEPMHVLFVGNSLTATNDLPAQVAALAKAAGHRLETDAVIQDGFSLEDHWKRGAALSAIASGRWDVVILQQGPSSLPESQAHLREWTARYAALARKAGTRAGLLTVWPESARRTRPRGRHRVLPQRGRGSPRGALPGRRRVAPCVVVQPQARALRARRLPPQPARDAPGRARRLRPALQGPASVAGTGTARRVAADGPHVAGVRRALARPEGPGRSPLQLSGRPPAGAPTSEQPPS